LDNLILNHLLIFVYLKIKMNRKKLFFLSFFLVIVSYSIYRYSHSLQVSASLYINSKILIESFLKNETLANEKYVGKIIQIDGIIEEISYLNNRNTIILKGTSKYSSVLCEMNHDQYQDVRKLVIGQKIFIRGQCKGFLNDVIFLNCILIDTEKKG
jgi:tRNA_anti-like